MIVLIDESGDTGLKINKGSSRYFVVALVVFEKNEEAIKCDDLIERIKTRTNSEFKFSKLKKENRINFAKTILKSDFYYFAVVINKDLRKLYGSGFRVKESFYKYACKLVLEKSKRYLEYATVIIDGSGSREFKKQLKVYFRKNMKAGKINKVKVQDSRKNNLIQLADFVAGAVHRSFGSKTDNDLYREKLRSREKGVQIWPK